MTVGAGVTRLEQINLTDHELFRRGFPHEVFTLLRAEAPVWRHPAMPGTTRIDRPFWVVSRHADVVAISRDHARFRSLEGPSLPGDPPNQQGLRLVSMDPPEHTRLRTLISKGFTPRMTAKLEDQARQWAGTIIDHALERGDCDFVNEVAYQLPLHMIADIVGIPRSDREWLFGKVNVLLQASDPQSFLTPDERADILREMFGYAHELGSAKRRAPADDVWTKLTTAEIDQPDGSRTELSEFELDLFFIVLVFAGSETTRNAIASGLLALLEHPDQFERMRIDPSVLPTAVEEICRWSSPVSYFRRTAVEDVVVGDACIEAGDAVSLWYASANRDAAVFADPFAFDISRERNPHVGFGGGGAHYCLGANLAKREIQVMFDELTARVTEVGLLGEPEYSVQGAENPITVSLRQLPVRLTPR
ncbi:cytochrome P450 [Mycobacterium sp. SMC-2]|uniref:cytochrome P450 n=1 Tax=Mycobacterium sp. SMC-2 TaxID=2857058 RepID=UPI0021B1A31A|nr:cytochrome P450 [Mycobacterium sp. SMC-2]UXA06196.1 cytochrome P450 [Mycobacterium sp. SMC-2]